MREEVLLTGRSGSLYGTLWIPVSDPTRGVVIAVHGLGDHSQRFATIANELCESGWALFAFDIQGHGRSPGVRGKVDNYDGLLADIATARMTVQQRLGDQPQVLLGHSMGGNLVLNYTLRAKEFEPITAQLAGSVLISPMILPPDPPQRPHIFAAWLTGRMFPWLRIGKSVEKEKLTSDPSQASSILADSLTHTRISIDLATQLLAQGRWALDHAREVDIPTLIMHGDQDDLIDQSACENLAVRIGEQATHIRWPEMRHALFHDVGHKEVIEQLVDWLGKTNR